MWETRTKHQRGIVRETQWIEEAKLEELVWKKACNEDNDNMNIYHKKKVL